MILPALLALLTALAIGALLVPLLRGPRPVRRRLDYDLAVYRDQLAELERDQARGAIAPDAAEGARREIERRILAAGRAEPAEPAAARPSPSRLAAILAVGLPLLALAAYLSIGRPDLPAQPFAARLESPGATATAALAEELERRLAQKPDDLQGWALLGRTYVTLNRFPQAVTAFSRAIALAPPDAASHGELLSAYAEALVLAANGDVTPQAREALAAALQRQPDDARAIYYLGLGEAQAGQPRQALARWLELEADSPPDAPWLAMLRSEIQRVASETGIDPQAIRPDRKPPPAATGPTLEQVERLSRLPEAEREAAIRGMVEGLAQRLKAEPENVEGWKRLARAYMVLGNYPEAARAFDEAEKRAPGDPGLMTDRAEALLRAAPPDEPVPPEAVALLRRLLDIQPANALALYYLGQAEAEAGNPEAARRLWSSLLARVPASAPQRVEIEKRLEALPK